MEKEIWKDVPGYEDQYEASSFGRVRSKPRTSVIHDKRGFIAYRQLSGRLLKQHQTPNGYMKVTLFSGGVARQINVHRLVMLTFMGPSELTVNHKDENKLNNRLDNLEYMTGADNTRYSCCKSVESYDLSTGKTVKRYKSMVGAEVDGHDGGAISNVCLQKKGFDSHHGLGWRFASD